MNWSTIKKRLKNNRITSDFMNYKTLIQLMKYLTSGTLSFLLDYIFFYILLGVFKTWYIPSNASMIVGFATSFFLNRVWSFDSKDNILKQLLLYTALFLFNLGAHNVLMYLLSDILYISPLISKAVVMGTIAAWNFVVFKKVVYRK